MTVTMHNIFIWIGVFFLILIPTYFIVGKDIENDKERFKEIPPETQVFSLEGAYWPGIEEIKAKRVPDKDVPARQLKGTCNWIRKWIKEKWLPDDLEKRFIPLRRLHRRDDYFIVRYQVDDWLVQLKDSERLHITVSSLNGSTMPEDISPYVLNTIRTFTKLNKRIDNLKLERYDRQIGTNLYHGRFRERTTSKPSPLVIEWASDGRCICFCLTKWWKVDPEDEGGSTEFDSNYGDRWFRKITLIKEKMRIVGHKKFGISLEEKMVAKKFDELRKELGESPYDPEVKKKYDEFIKRLDESPDSLWDSVRPSERVEPKPKTERTEPEPETTSKERKPDIAAPEQKVIETNTNWQIPLMIIGAVVGIGLVIYMLIRRRK